jgi:pyridoxine 5-phosphate synthase|tara:strand:+ start:579 stop:1301 length:723 start_codon:yes stop_codon:yes gene_type:complete
MNKIRLGVNIDHVATVRNARGEKYPSPLRAAIIAENCGAHSVTIHLREDRRHINDSDLKEIKSKLKIPLNLEIAATKEMLKIAIKHRPNFVCIVPEKRREITTEGGLNLNFKQVFLKQIIKKLKKNNSRVSVFIEPTIKDVKISKYLDVDGIELHTGRICNLINKNKPYGFELSKLNKAANFATELGMDVHAGHGLTYKSAKIISKIKKIKEFNIGHFLIGETIYIGLPAAIKKFQKILK